MKLIAASSFTGKTRRKFEEEQIRALGAKVMLNGDENYCLTLSFFSFTATETRLCSLPSLSDGEQGKEGERKEACRGGMADTDSTVVEGLTQLSLVAGTDHGQEE